MSQDKNRDKQSRATEYYNKFSKVYDYLSPKIYYHKARNQAVKELYLKEGMSVLNVPVGTGQNFEYFQQYLKNTGTIIGIDISPGMLEKAELKTKKHHWSNIELFNCDVLAINETLAEDNRELAFSAILCDLGLSGFPNWEDIIDNLITMLKPEGRIVIMDWYIPHSSLRGQFIKWVGKGEVNRPIGQYLESRVDAFNIDSSFNRGGVFVASGTKKKQITNDFDS